MTHSIIIPVMNELHETKGIMYLLKEVTDPGVEFVFIDNGSTDDWEGFVYNYLKPKKTNFIRNESNIGLVKTMQQAYEETTSDILTFIHNDVYIYDNSWSQNVENLMSRKEIGMIGAFGSGGVHPNGGRTQLTTNHNQAPGISNMVEAEVHGQRIMNDQFKYVSIFDGFFMSIKREVLDKAGGFDQQYQWHHFYDRDICLESLRHGYKNIVLGIKCHHVSGRTANQSHYQNMIRENYGTGKFDHTKQYDGDKATHDDNMWLFEKKWDEVLPLHVDMNTGDYITSPMFKGDRIVGYKK